MEAGFSREKLLLYQCFAKLTISWKKPISFPPASPPLAPHVFKRFRLLLQVVPTSTASERRQENTEAAKALSNNSGGKNTLAYIFYFIFFLFWDMEKG